MGSADNLNYDCLQLIISYLAGDDLFAVAHVSRSFLTVALPQLYRNLTFHLGNGKRYPKVSMRNSLQVLGPTEDVHLVR